MYDDYRGGQGGSIFFAFLLGGAIGAILGLLYAPRSGKETRDLLAEKSQECRDQSRELYETGKVKVSEAGDEFKDRFDTAKSKLKEQVDQVSSIAREKASEAGEAVKAIKDRLDKTDTTGPAEA